MMGIRTRFLRTRSIPAPHGVLGLAGAGAGALCVGLAACGSGESSPDATAAGAAEASETTSENGDGFAVRVPEGIDVPDGMVYVPGGVTRIGAEDGLPHEQPAFEAEVEPFFLDEHPVTVAKFRAFIESTGHVTDAERLGDAGVLDLSTGAWRLVPGATWHHPLGPDGPEAPADHPVTQVSWHDAVAYAEWAGKRLPTEVEWEHAARAGRDARQPYAWGDSLVESGKHRANTWQGEFPAYNTGDDGHLLTSPVGAFGHTELGLTDMGGNVWEWTADWFRSYAERGRPFTATPESEKAQRGGSFLCHESYCHGYRVSGRSHSTPETSLFHVGFRCARDVGI